MAKTKFKRMYDEAVGWKKRAKEHPNPKERQKAKDEMKRMIEKMEKDPGRGR